MRVPAWLLPDVQEGGEQSTGGSLWDPQKTGRHVSAPAQVSRCTLGWGGGARGCGFLPFLRSVQGLLPFLSEAEIEHLSNNSYFKAMNTNRRLTFTRQSSSISME